jgi:hypothetical protein
MLNATTCRCLCMRLNPYSPPTRIAQGRSPSHKFMHWNFTTRGAAVTLFSAERRAALQARGVGHAQTLLDAHQTRDTFGYSSTLILRAFHGLARQDVGVILWSEMHAAPGTLPVFRLARQPRTDLEGSIASGFSRDTHSHVVIR